MTDKTINVDLNLNVNDRDAARSAANVSRGFEDAEKAVARTRDQMEKLAQVGGRLAMVGAAITGPLALAVKNYADKYKETEPLAMRFVAAQQKLVATGERLGRVFAAEIVPWLERAASIAEKIAGYLEANPGVANAILNIGAILTASGALISAVGTIGSTIATVQGLGGAGAAAGAARGPGAASKLGTVALYASAVVIGAGFGQELGNAILKATGQQEYDAGLSARQLGQSVAASLALVFREIGLISDESAKKIQQASLALFGFTQQTSQASTQAQTMTDAVTQLGSAAAVAATQVALTGDTFKAQSSKLTDAQQQAADLQRQIADQDRQRAAQRQQIVDNYNQQAQQAAEDHAIQMRNIERRRLRDVADAAESRDALAIDRANEAAAEEKQDAEEQYSLDARRRAEALKLQLKQFDAESRYQREANIRKLNELNTYIQYELSLVQQAETIKMQIFQNTLAQLQGMLNTGGGTTPLASGSEFYNIPAPSGNIASGSTSQVFNLSSSTGTTLLSVQREIASAQADFASMLNSALAGI